MLACFVAPVNLASLTAAATVTVLS